MMVLAKSRPLLGPLAVGLIVACGMLTSAVADIAPKDLPVLTGGAIPLYPRVALRTRVHGAVKIRVTTDGKKVASVEALSGPPLLVNAAEENIRTWKLDQHRPATFITTFEYVIEDPAECGFSNGTSVLALPLEARIVAKGWRTCDPAEQIKRKAPAS